MFRSMQLAAAAIVGLACSEVANAATMMFFSSDQVATLITEGPTWDQIRSNGYYFTYTRDKLFTGGLGQPIGRPVYVNWPDGVEAQAVTAGPNPSKATITIERVDGTVFDFSAFTARLLANTAGAGGSFEVVPFLNGQEVLPDPVVFDATGYYWSTFSYNQSPNPWGSTAPLVGYDKYTIDLYVDFALIGLTFEGVPIPTPPGDYNGDYVVNAADYVVWRKTDGSQPGYNAWRANFGYAAGSGSGAGDFTSVSSAIPEPQPLAILLLVGAGLARTVRWDGRWQCISQR
jgi:hypothetical protein